MEELINQLSSIGLSRKEAIVYLVALEFGRSGANAIANRTHLPRATTYTILRELIEKGLMTMYVEGGEHRYGAEHPKQLLSLILFQADEIRKRRRDAESLLPKLEAMFNVRSDKPMVRYFEGVDGLKRMRREYDALNDDLLQMVGYDTYLALVDSTDYEEQLDEVKTSRRRIRSIVVTNRTDLRMPENVEWVAIPPAVAPIKGEMTVCGDKVAMFSYASGIIAVEITSPAIAETARATLELAWRWAKGLGGR